MHPRTSAHGRHPGRLPRLLSGKVLALLAVALATSTAIGLLASYLSPAVERDIPTVTPSVTLTVEGVPTNASAGDIFTLTATMKNNANRPTPAVLRFTIRNPDGIDYDEITVYADCGAEERVSSKTLIYYVGWHGPLLAPNGTGFAVGTTVATVESTLGEGAHWSAVLREIQGRDPQGYESLIDPGTNASAGPRDTTSSALKVLYYYGMVEAADETSTSPEEWSLTIPFADALVATGGTSQEGFQVEIDLNAKGSYEFTFWAERPDGLGVPNHPWQCEPL